MYIDDLLIYSNTKEEHLKLLSLVFERLASANLIVNVLKCHFLQKEVKFLGHIVDSSGVHVDQSYVKAVDEFTTKRREVLATVLRTFELLLYVRTWLRHHCGSILLTVVIRSRVYLVRRMRYGLQ